MSRPFPPLTQRRLRHLIRKQQRFALTTREFRELYLLGFGVEEEILSKYAASYAATYDPSYGATYVI
ncbi:hypothetical protein [Hymenobacter guriensis]|uniref:Uncharacterized protein n=1 Tax=Hymenobacter guriensis TaxID=2793065 RepID=A0ABS0L0P0_9BACT|nr:hypothetical protein [Hymenobacter guriensis]MBG8553681.1 hypothetical protein [Hymenobacter guriensis]